MALNLNKAMIIGNVTRDPETRATPSGQQVANFGVATNRRWKDAQSGEMKEAVEFHNIVAWGRLAETCGQYLKKGGKVYVEGRIQTRQWEDQTGAKKNRTEIVAETMIMLDRAPQQPVQPASPTSAPQQPESEEINVEDIPF